jgi:hypothetical protein
MVSAACAKAEYIARKQQVDNLPPAVRSRRKPSRHTGFDPVPALDRAVFFVDLLAANVARTDGKGIQSAQSALGACVALMRPNRLARANI